MTLNYRGQAYQSEPSIPTAETTLSGKYRGTELTFSTPVMSPQGLAMQLRYRGQRYSA